MVNLDEVDRQIADWQAKLASARDNLLALYDHPTYKRLDSRTDSLTGATASLVTPALATMNDLFSQIGLLTDVIDRAAKLRQASGRFTWSDRSARQIQALLQGPSIQLPPVATPLEQRGLLTAAERTQAITPERLLSAMTQAFEAAKSAVLAIDAAWARVDPMLASWGMKLDALASTAKALGDDASAQVESARQQLEALRSISRSDPLALARGGGDQMQDALERLRVRLESLAHQRTDLHARLDAAKAIVAAIAGGRMRADAAAAKCRQCIDRPVGLLGSVTDKQMADMSDWLDALVDCDHQGRWTALAKGLDRWEQLAAECTDAQNAAVAANEGLLESLAELRGRVSALKFKARARGIAASPAFAQAERLATECLGRPLVPLDQAAKLVADYERQLGAG